MDCSGCFGFVLRELSVRVLEFELSVEFELIGLGFKLESSRTKFSLSFSCSLSLAGVRARAPIAPRFGAVDLAIGVPPLQPPLAPIKLRHPLIVRFLRPTSPCELDLCRRPPFSQDPFAPWPRRPLAVVVATDLSSPFLGWQSFPRPFDFCLRPDLARSSSIPPASCRSPLPPPDLTCRRCLRPFPAVIYPIFQPIEPCPLLIALSRLPILSLPPASFSDRSCRCHRQVFPTKPCAQRGPHDVMDAVVQMLYGHLPWIDANRKTLIR